MKSVALRAVLVLLLCVRVYSSAGQAESFPSYYNDFRNRLQSAVEKRDLVAIRALYQTNGVAVADLNSELACWRPLLEENAKTRVNYDLLYYKDLSRAWPGWKDTAHVHTTYEVTHLVNVPWVAENLGGNTLLPLAFVQGRLLVVPSNKKKPHFDFEPRASAGGSER